MPGSRSAYWRGKRSRGQGLFASACGSPAEAIALMKLAPDLIVYHPAFPARPDWGGETGMLSSLVSSGNANREAADGIGVMLPICSPCPVAMGVCGTDPFLLPGPALSAWLSQGVEGLANFPTIGLVDGFFRADLDASRLDFSQEAACLGQARERGFFTVAFVCRPEDAALMAKTGCDALILHLGLTARAEPRPLAQARLDALPAFLSALKGKGIGPLLLLHSDHLVSSADESEWKAMLAAGEGCDGLFAAGGAERAAALRGLIAG